MKHSRTDSGARALAQRAPQVRPRNGAPERRPEGPRTFRTQVAVGDVICFDPTGEQLRVTRIEDGRITFEKQP